MTKIQDDWMHPNLSSSIGWSAKPRDKEEFIIQRERVIICTWSGDGPPREWGHWRTFDTRKERDAELKRLRETTTWHLRPAYYSPTLRREEIEDERIDLLWRLASLKS